MEIDDKNDCLVEAERLISIENYSAAIDLLENLEDKKLLHPKIPVLKYLCMSLIEEPVFTPEETEKVLNQALKLDAGYLPAIIELAYLKMNVFDNPAEAMPLFENSIEMIKDLITEAVLGKAQCIAELKGSQSAISFIREQQKNLISPVKLEEFINEVDIFEPK